MYSAEVNQKWGFIDRNGNWILQPTFDEGQFLIFYKNLAIITNHKKYGIINTDGEIVFEINNDYIEFEYGYFKISKENKYGYIDKNCEWIIPAIFDCENNDNEIDNDPANIRI